MHRPTSRAELSTHVPPVRRRRHRGIAVVGVLAACAVALVVAWSTTGFGARGTAGATATFEPVVATLVGSNAELYPAPSSSATPTSFPGHTDFGARDVFLVKATQGSWLDVYVPQRPNGSTAWIPLSEVTLAKDDYEVVVSLSQHSLEVRDAGRAILDAPVATGAPATPTPVGTYFLTELLRQPDPSGAYGSYAYGVSAFSDVLLHFGGGPGQIGLHGTNDPSSIGTASSHGCIRVTNAVIARLVPMLPLGTPVVVAQ